MGLTYVGGTTAYAEGATSGDLTVSLTSLTGGSGTAPQENDLVIVSFSVASITNKNLYLVSEGYYRWCDLYANDTHDTNLWVFTKQMGVTPDTSVVVPPSGSVGDALTVMVQVWRPSNGNSVYLYPAMFVDSYDDGGGQPIPPAITPVIASYLDKAQIICIGASADVVATDFTSSQLSNFITVTSEGTHSSMLGGGSYEWSSGLFTPTKFGGGSVATTACWCAVSFFLVDSPNTIKLLKTKQHDTSSSNQSLIKLDDTHVMLAYSGSLGSTIKTFLIDSSYDVTEIDSIFVGGGYNSLVKINDTHFVLAYQGPSNSAMITTLSIDSSYNITQINSLQYASDGAEFIDLIKIDDTHVVSARRNVADDGYLTSFSIDGSYNLTQLDSMLFSFDDSYNSLLKLDDTHFALFSRQEVSGNDKLLAGVYSLDSSYNISTTYTSEVFRGGSFDIRSDLMDNTHAVLTFTGGDRHSGYFQTCLINNETYKINAISSRYFFPLVNPFKGSYIYTRGLVSPEDNYYIVSFYGDKTTLRMYYINDDYTFTEVYDFIDTVNADVSRPIAIDKNHLILSYGGGIIKTFSVNEVSRPNTSNFFPFF